MPDTGSRTLTSFGDRRWSEADVATLWQMTADGASDAEIAAKLSRTVAAVIYQRRAKHLKPRGDAPGCFVNPNLIIMSLRRVALLAQAGSSS